MEVFPKLDLEFVKSGMTLKDVATHFEVSVPPSLAADGCVAFTYDQELVGDSRSITVLFKGGRVQDRWLEEKVFTIEQCANVLHRAVLLKGYAHAGVC